MVKPSTEQEYMTDSEEMNGFHATSPRQVLNTPMQIKREPAILQFEDNRLMINPRYTLTPDQQSNMDVRFDWGDYRDGGSVTSDIISQGDMASFGIENSAQHPFDTVYDQYQFPIPYNSPPMQQNTMMNIEQFNYSQHRGSLPIIHNAAELFSASVPTTTAAATTTTIPPAAAAQATQAQPDAAGHPAPFARRYTEGSIPSLVSTSSTTNRCRAKKSRTNSASSIGKEDEDEESKRKHFLERNRQAALKCRQRKKQWLANLQHRVEFLSTDNEQLQCQATMLREEVINLKTLLLAHRDCKVAQANGTTASIIQSVSTGNNPTFVQQPNHSVAAMHAQQQQDRSQPQL